MPARHPSGLPYAAAAMLALALAACATGGRAAPRYFKVVNAGHDSVMALAIAPAGSGAFREVEIGPPLRGGVNDLTFEVPPGVCRRDLRVNLRDGRTLLYPDLDLCRYGVLRLTPRDGRAARDRGAQAVAGAR